VRIYLDNCCYNRPYDDQSQMRINLETQAKLYIQELVRRGKVELATSFVLEFENAKNRYEMKRKMIKSFMDEYATVYVGRDAFDTLQQNAEKIMQTGVKEKDAFHVAAAIYADCDCFISTDDRLLKFKTDEIRLVTPIELIRETEGIL